MHKQHHNHTEVLLISYLLQGFLSQSIDHLASWRGVLLRGELPISTAGSLSLDNQISLRRAFKELLICLLALILLIRCV